MDWQLVASYFTIKSTDIFYSVVGLDKIPYAAYDHTFFMYHVFIVDYWLL